MRLLWGSKDGGPESRVRMWGIESKRWGSLLLLRFEEGTREAFHTHAFNSWSWVLSGVLVEQTLAEKGESWNPSHVTWAGFGPSFRPIYTDRRRFHRVAGGSAGAWVLTVRGPWWDGWREYDPITGRQTKLTHGRQQRDMLRDEKPASQELTLVCATCLKRPSVGVACVPGMAVSEAWCAECLQGDAIPWALCVAQTACLGGRHKCNDLWQRTIEATCYLNNRTLAEFDQQVAAGVQAMGQLEEAEMESGGEETA